MVRATTEKRLRMSYNEYEAWVDEDTHSEWVDGEVTVFMPTTARHDQIVGLLYALLRLFVDLHEAVSSSKRCSRCGCGTVVRTASRTCSSSPTSTFTGSQAGGSTDQAI
jgi:hypothetical protein